jgi:excisionase family DNA binding protein
VDRSSEGDDTDFGDLPSKTLLRPEEVALFLSVSLKTVYRWYHSGIIDGTKMNRCLRIRRDSVLKLIDGENGLSHR